MAALLVAVAPAVGCSLLTSLDGLSGGAPDSVDAALDVPTTEAGGVDAGVDALVTDAAMDADALPIDAATRVATLYVFAGATDVGTTGSVVAADIHPDGTLGAWKSISSLPESRTYAQAVLGPDFVAVVGGSGPSGDVTSTFVAKTQSTGPGLWSALGMFAVPRIRHGATFANGHLYVIGGTDGSDTPIADVQVATISSTAIGAFASTTPLPAARSRHSVASTSKYLYVFGGLDALGNAVPDVYRAPFDMDGTLGAFEAQSALPGARTHAQANIVVPGHVLVTGGEGVTDSAIVYDIDMFQGTLSAPSTTLPLPAPTNHHAAATFGNHIYVIGGFGATGLRLTDVVVGDVSANGTVTKWTPTTSLPVGLAYHSAVAF